MPFPDTYEAPESPIRIEIGAVFSKDWTFEQPAGIAIDLTGHTAIFKVVDECGEEIMNLTDGSGITITGATGQVVVKANSVTTAALTARSGRYVLKLTETSTSETTKALEGNVTITPDI